MESYIHIGIILSLAFMPSCLLMSLQEPKCSSKFDFEEKLLEKAVKMDHQMQVLQTNVDKRLEELQSEKVSMKRDLSTMSTQFKELSTNLSNEQQIKNDDLTTLVKTLSDAIELKLEEIVSKMKTETAKKVEEMYNLMKLYESQMARMSSDLLTLTNETLDKMKDKQAAFSVTSPSTTLVNGVPIFTNIITNVGGGYNAGTGKFTCTVAGLYLFSLTLLSNKSSVSVYCYIRQNNSNKTFSQAYYHIESTTVIVTLSLQAGDVVNLGECSSWNLVNTGIGTVFNGVLVTES